MKNKIIFSTLVAVALLVGLTTQYVAHAQTASSSSSTPNTREKITIYKTCITTATQKQRVALKDAKSIRDKSLTDARATLKNFRSAAATTYQSEIVSAKQLTNQTARRTALKDAKDKLTTARKTAQDSYNTSVKSAHDTYTSSVKNIKDQFNTDKLSCQATKNQ